jgi:hypothetical protein
MKSLISLLFIITCPYFFTDLEETAVKKITVYIVPFDVHTRLPLDSISIRNYPGVKKRTIKNKKAFEISRLLKTSAEFDTTKCDLDIRIFCEIEFEDRTFRNISIGTTKHMNANGKCYFPNGKMIRFLRNH